MLSCTRGVILSMGCFRTAALVFNVSLLTNVPLSFCFTPRIRPWGRIFFYHKCNVTFNFYMITFLLIAIQLPNTDFYKQIPPNVVTLYISTGVLIAHLFFRNLFRTLGSNNSQPQIAKKVLKSLFSNFISYYARVSVLHKFSNFSLGEYLLLTRPQNIQRILHVSAGI